MYICNCICVLFEGEFDHAIKLSQPKLIFASMAMAPRALKISRSNTFVRNVIFMESNAQKRGKKLKTKFTISYSELISSIPVSQTIIKFVHIIVLNGILILLNSLI